MKRCKIRQVELRDVRLTKKSYDSLKSLKNSMWGNVADAIECPVWMIPSETYEYGELKKMFETEVAKEFFSLPESAVVEVQSFKSNILSFHDGIYPDYSKRRK